jgi:TRAP-type C4-dicarboxylate transport system substrate-binding protein
MVLYALPSPPAARFSRQPIARVEDLAGAPLAAADPWLRRLASDIGARPLELADADLPRRFGPGSGGQPPPRAALLAPFTAAVRVEAWRRLGHAYDVQASFPLAVVAVNQQAFYALDEASQRALLNAAVDAQNAAWRGSIDERNARVAELGERNLVVQPPAAALQDGLAQAGARLVGEWLNAAGPDGQAILAAYRAGGP